MNKIAIYLRRNIYYICRFLDMLPMVKKPDVIILDYHNIGPDDWRFCIDEDTFVRQIEYLKKRFNFIKLSEIQDYFDNRLDRRILPAVVLTFDDGYTGIKSIRGYLKKSGIKPALFVMSDNNNLNRKELDNTMDLLSGKEIQELVTEGWEVGSHSATHPDFSSLNSEEIEKEVILSKRQLEKTLGLQIRYFAYPKGRYTNKIVTEVEKAGYILALTMDDGLVNINTGRYQIPRIGVDRTHSFTEFKSLIGPTAIKFRKLMKAVNFGKSV